MKVKRVALKAADVTDASFSGRIREGRMTPSPFAANIAGVPFSGAVALDLRGQVPEASLWVAANDVDVGRLLRDFKIVQDLDARVESLRVQLIGRGSRLGEMLEKSALEVNLDGGLTMRDAKGKPLIEVALKTGVASSLPEKPVSLTLDGAIDETPVAIRVSSGTLIDFLRVKDYVPFALSAEAAGAQLDLKGRVTLPITSRSGELRLLVKGERLDSMNKLARVELPPWGPWSFGGSFRAPARLRGARSAGAHGQQQPGRPRHAQCHRRASAPGRIAHRTARAARRLPVRRLVAVREEGEETGQAHERGGDACESQGRRGTGAEAAEPRDAAARRRLSGRRGGAGPLRSRPARQRQAARATGERQARVRPGNGERAGRLDANLQLSYEPTDRDVVVALQLRVDRFDYGILARRIKPDTDLQGLFSLNVDLDGRAPTLDAVMAHANGHIDFAVWPKNMRSGIFDLWAVNSFWRWRPRWTRPRNPRSTARWAVSTCATASSPRTPS